MISLFKLIYLTFESAIQTCLPRSISSTYKKFRTLLVISRRARDMHSSCYSYAIPFFYLFHRISFIRRYTTICLSDFEHPFSLKFHEFSSDIQKGEQNKLYILEAPCVFNIWNHISKNLLQEYHKFMLNWKCRRRWR